MARSDFTTVRQLLRGMQRANSHAENLQAFYAPQARDYDRFRERLLQGRERLIELLRIGAGDRVVELGAGTGRVAAFYAERVPALASLTLVDLCPALLSKARERSQAWPHTAVIEADATRYRPPWPVDKAYFSYALTMIPDWFLAIDNAVAMLQPGGVVGVVDFHVSRARPMPGGRRHSVFTRHFWPLWFAHDGVNVSSEHVPYLRSRLTTVHFEEGMTRVPWMPGFHVPYYVFVGRKRVAA